MCQFATIQFDTGFRPEETMRFRWENIMWNMGRNGAIRNLFGKTAAARRVLPMSPRVRAILEARYKKAGKPSDGWVFPAKTKCGHINGSSIDRQHARAFANIEEYVAKHGGKPVEPFVMYSARHTFLTRLGCSRGPNGEALCDVWTLARVGMTKLSRK